MKMNEIMDKTIAPTNTTAMLCAHRINICSGVISLKAALQSSSSFNLKTLGLPHLNISLLMVNLLIKAWNSQMPKLSLENGTQQLAVKMNRKYVDGWR